MTDIREEVHRTTEGLATVTLWSWRDGTAVTLAVGHGFTLADARRSALARMTEHRGSSPGQRRGTGMENPPSSRSPLHLPLGGPERSEGQDEKEGPIAGAASCPGCGSTIRGVHKWPPREACRPITTTKDTTPTHG